MLLKPLAAVMILMVMAACGHTTPQPPSGPSQLSGPDTIVNALLDQDYEAAMRFWPVWATLLGDRRYDAELADLSPESLARELEATKHRLNRARSVNRANLSDEGRTNLDLLIWELTESIDFAKTHPEQTPINQMGGPHTSLAQLPDRITFSTPQHFRDYVERLRKIPAYLDQSIRHMQAGLAAGRTPPQVVMKGVADQVRSQATPAAEKQPERHALYKPFLKHSPKDALATQAREVIGKEIIPAFGKLAAFLEDTYIPGCRTSIAASDGPGGIAYYQQRLQHFTTLTLSPKEIHETGLREVARIRAEMMATIARSDFPQKDAHEGDAAFAAFVEYLRTNSRFYYTSADEMLRDYAHIAKQMDAALPRLFGRLPRLPYGIRAMPDFIAATAPTAYYYEGSPKNGVPGTFIVNTSQLNQRPRYEMRALAFHEAVPGHHLQIALSQELEEAGLHRWRTLKDYTAFVEGWALYSERLGLEVGDGEDGRGFYTDPYDDFGRLSYEMWRALRLVVDTGLHAFGWSRDKTIAYMLANSALTRKNVENEVNRYIVWPGQAVAYKTGELQIRKLRQRAEETLGTSFNVKAFHDVVLGAGAVPLEVLERRVGDWIEKVHRSKGPGHPTP